jgi:hypothetical protein
MFVYRINTKSICFSKLSNIYKIVYYPKYKVISFLSTLCFEKMSVSLFDRPIYIDKEKWQKEEQFQWQFLLFP